MTLLQPAHQREQRDVEENRTPVELLQALLEFGGLFHPVTEQRQQQHQRKRTGQRDKAQSHANIFARRHRNHRTKKPADDDGGEQRVFNLGFNTQRGHVGNTLVAAEPIPIHEGQCEEEGHHQDRERRRTVFLPDEIKEFCASNAVQHLRRQIADDQRGAHEVGAETDHQNHWHRRQFQRAAQRKRHRCHHQNGHHVIHEHRYEAREEGENNHQQARPSTR